MCSAKRSYDAPLVSSTVVSLEDVLTVANLQGVEVILFLPLSHALDIMLLGKLQYLHARDKLMSLVMNAGLKDLGGTSSN